MSGSSVHTYGSLPDQQAELTLPRGDGPHPVAVLLHGGFWRRRYDLTLMRPMALDLAQRGWAAWNVEYRRGAGAGPATLEDVTAALGALGGLDVPLAHERTVIIGHSAGGHLALSAAGTVPARVISLAGVCALTRAAWEGLGDDAVTEWVGAGPDAAPDLFAALDPMARLPTRAATLVVHGSADAVVPPEYSRAYEQAARAAGDACERLELDGVDHMAVIDPRSDAYRAWIRHLPSG